ncbi:two-component regulator propeller domain-containing protein [Siphonobacter sp. SORGH_AS_0500]|uniref:sensor histidine kinase n=1 Tax=Siphonobacter sp. SORGH_AS_0500 TaxID=1864824 RepID=UPI002863A638|nr:two-component regulator propeller domain-containing protein [Siphonobacter sp. SORGH_AS_0500]MDR6195806.1 ligand-binding sensor domain-containing protein/signal transduction histidine kinase [Siphonobacter sp. SORGH_AS_0500]
MRKLLVSLFLLWICGTGLAQPKPVLLDQYSVNEGLSQSEVTCLLKDQRGYVWLGTQNGLNRFDGHQFVHYHHQPFQAHSLSNDYILSLAESRQQIWIGTRQGLNRLDLATGLFTRIGETDLSYKITAKALAVDAQGFIWVGTTNGLFRVSPNVGQDFDFNHLLHTSNYVLKDRSIQALKVDSDGFLWVATNRGLYRISPEINHRRSVTRWKSWGTHVYAITQDHRKQLWVGTDQGLNRVDRQLPHRTTLAWVSQKPVLALLASHQNQLWVTVANEGVYRFDLRNPLELPLLSQWIVDDRTRKGLKSNRVTCLFEGPDPKEDVVWMGTRDAGVQAFSQSKNNFQHWESFISPASSLQLFLSVYTDKYQQLWMGSYHGLYRINRNTLEAKSYPDAGLGGAIHAFREDHQGNLWMGGEEGLWRYNRSADRFESVSLGHENVQVKCLFEDRQRNLWIGTDKGVFKRNQNGVLHRFHFHYDGPVSTVEAIHEQSDGSIWVGTLGGLFKMDPRGTISSFYNKTDDAHSLLSNEIYDLHACRNGQFWIASSKGLSRLYFEGDRARFEHFTEEQGLPNNVVYGLLEDPQGRLWMSTNKGISRFDPRTKAFRNYASSDGLLSNEFNVGAFHQSDDGEFFFGGIGILISFHPWQLRESQFLPPIVLTTFRKFEKSFAFDSLLAADKKLNINYNENFISFVYTALDYKDPQKNQYAYKLEGFQDDWNYSGQRRYLSFSNLNPGDYVLKVKASNADGVWNEQKLLEIPITVIPPFWQRWWFYISCALVAAAATWLFYTYRLRNQVARLLELEKVKLAENERVRKLAAQDLHDEFGNTITRISMLTEIIKTKLPEHSDNVLPLLTKISDNANRMYQGTKDFIWAINPDHDNLYEIAIRLKDFGDDVLDKTGIRFDIEGLTESLKDFSLPMGVSRHVIFLFKEAISNTLKHAQATETRLIFKQENNRPTIQWIDNGKGFESSKRMTGNGLLNMESRARKFNGTLQVISASEAGTSITLSLPAPAKK